MNTPPIEVAARVQPETLHRFASQVFQRLEMSASDANAIADLLVKNDLRGVVSHGTERIGVYVKQFQSGELNPRPDVRVVDDSPSTAIVDGDGGLGYLPAHKSVGLLVEKTRQLGIAAVLTRNHGHIGAAGLYSRIPAQSGFICYGTSGHQLNLKDDQLILRAAGGSPMTFAIPAAEEHPVVLDFGAMHDLYAGSPHVERLFELAPGMVYRSLGLGVMCQILGGFLAGVPVDPARADRAFSGANQGSLFIAIDVSRFLPADQFKAEVDEYIKRARAMQPMPGAEVAHLPGGPEAAKEQEYHALGIPFGHSSVDKINAVAETLNLTSPF